MQIVLSTIYINNSFFVFHKKIVSHTVPLRQSGKPHHQLKMNVTRFYRCLTPHHVKSFVVRSPIIGFDWFAELSVEFTQAMLLIVKNIRLHTINQRLLCRRASMLCTMSALFTFYVG